MVPRTASCFPDIAVSNIMIGKWLATRRRQRLLATPFPQEWREYLQKNVAAFALLTEHEQRKL